MWANNNSCVIPEPYRIERGPPTLRWREREREWESEWLVRSVDLYIPGPSPNSFVPSLWIHKFCPPLYDGEWIKMGIQCGAVRCTTQVRRKRAPSIFYLLYVKVGRRRRWMAAALCRALIYWTTFKLKTFNCALLNRMNLKPLPLFCWAIQAGSDSWLCSLPTLR